MTYQDIPTINAALNATATALMTAGFIFIKSGRKDAHRAAMLTAGVVSALFLIGYVTHKAFRGADVGAGGAIHTRFGGQEFIKYVYYTMLFTHVTLAMAIAYLVPRTFAYALKGDIEGHKRWARFTFPIWYYVSITGVLVYLFLYRWWPAQG